MESQNFAVNPNDPASHMPIIQALVDRNNELTGQIEVLMMTIGSAFGTGAPAKAALLGAVANAREHGWDSRLLTILERSLQVAGSPPPKGGTHLRIVGGTEGPEAKAA